MNITKGRTLHIPKWVITWHIGQHPPTPFENHISSLWNREPYVAIAFIGCHLGDKRAAFQCDF